MVHKFIEPIFASERGRQISAMVAMLAAAFLWAVVEHLGGLVPKIYSPVQTVWSRYAAHLLFMLIVFAPRRKTALIRTSCLSFQVLRAILMVGMPAFYIWAVALLPVQFVWLISWISVPMILILGKILIREPVWPGLWIAVGIGWIGIWAMSGIDCPPVSWNYLVPIGMGLCFALYVVMTRQMRKEDTCVKLFHTAFWVFLVTSLIVPFHWVMPSIKVMVVYTCIGLSGYFCLYFLDKSVELSPVSITAPLLYTIPLWSCLQTFFVHGKFPGGMAAVGALMISTISALVILIVCFGQIRSTVTD